ncbi:hypothetical protein [Actinoplanes flavus]|uniref:Uncharacterized protein n=1 Tax=Actinoplanes flavus TaxID=2820290 RepID=A0ABS3US65_9ACTN|nr:hypothetical protein [Actinoplanes flavus]MBO3741422.1 hypothetical protein [Actinoplanes flavus]
MPAQLLYLNLFSQHREDYEGIFRALREFVGEIARARMQYTSATNALRRTRRCFSAGAVATASVVTGLLAVVASPTVISTDQHQAIKVDPNLDSGGEVEVDMFTQAQTDLMTE